MDEALGAVRVATSNRRFANAIAEAQLRYPKLAFKTELHHIVPKYHLVVM